MINSHTFSEVNADDIVPVMGVYKYGIYCMLVQKLFKDRVNKLKIKYIREHLITLGVEVDAINDVIYHYNLFEVTGKEPTISLKHREEDREFPEGFSEVWEVWTDYKKNEHRDKYKTLKSEQEGINNLVEISHADSEIALMIVKQSIANLWKGLFPLKNHIYDPNKRGIKTNTQSWSDWANSHAHPKQTGK